MKTSVLDALPMDEIHTVCNDVEHGSDVQELVDKMRSVMYERGGAGLAANQIGDTRRVVLINTTHCKKVIINPVIVKVSDKQSFSEEGCLSFPNKTVLVKRHKKIIVEGYGQDWEKIRLKLNGFCSRCVQHEVDHLNGIDFTMKGVN